MAFVPSPMSMDQTRSIQQSAPRFSTERRICRGLMVNQGSPCRFTVYDPTTNKFLAEFDAKLTSGAEVTIPEQHRGVISGPQKFLFRVTPLFTLPVPKWGSGDLL